MAWIEPRYRVCMAEPRLRGLVVIKQTANDDPPVGTMYSWANVQGRESFWGVLDDEGHRLKHEGKFVSLHLPNNDAGSLASRCQRRAFRKALADGTLMVADECRTSWFDRHFLLVSGIALAIWWGPGVLGMLCRMLRGEELWVTGDWLVLLYVSTVFMSLVYFGMVGLCLKWGISILVRPNARHARFTSMGVHAKMTDGREVAAAWCDLAAIKRQPIMVGLRFREAGDLWLPGFGPRCRRLLSIVEERFLFKDGRPNPFARRPLMIRGTVIALACTILSAWLLDRFVPGRPIPLFAAAMFLLILAFYALLAFSPKIHRWERRRWRRKKRALRMRSLPRVL